MATLYGNDTAINSARLGGTYLPGSVISLVTWSQRDDAHWFGGRIPNAVRSIEILRFAPANTYIANSEIAPPSYERYEGAVPVLVKSPGQADEQRRINYIMNLKAAVLP